MKKSQKWKNKLKKLVMYGPKKPSAKEKSWNQRNNQRGGN
jgi:hypothetical protein